MIGSASWVIIKISEMIILYVINSDLTYHLLAQLSEIPLLEYSSPSLVFEKVVLKNDHYRVGEQYAI